MSRHRTIGVFVLGGAIACAPSRPVVVDGPEVEPTDAGNDAPAAAADAGTLANVDKPACAGAPACERLVFASYERPDGMAVTSVAEGDAICLRAATSSASRVKGRTFRAWLSDSSTSPAMRLVHGQKPYRLVSGAVVAQSWEDLVDGSLRTGVAEDENGSAMTGAVWTNTHADGTAAAPCADYSSTGTAGSTRSTDAQWTDSPKSCREQGHVYCFEE
jgi:hypothetical protein